MSLINSACPQINTLGIKKSDHHTGPVYLSRPLRQFHLPFRVNAFDS